MRAFGIRFRNKNPASLPGANTFVSNPNRKENTAMKGNTKGISTALAIAFVFSLLLSAPALVSAQTYSEQVSRKVKEEIALTREVIQVKRKAIVASNLGLTDYESKAFWPVYEEYWSERKKLADRHITLLSDFAKNYVYESLTNKRAEEMLKEWLSVETTTSGLRALM